MPFTINALDIIDAIESPKSPPSLIEAERRASMRHGRIRNSLAEWDAIVDVNVGVGIAFEIVVTLRAT